MSEWKKVIVRVWGGAPSEGAEYLGTAFFVSPTQLLTARHVIKPCPEWKKIRLADGPWLGGLMGLSAEPVPLADKDVALLTIARPVDGIKPIQASETDPKEGETLILAGFGSKLQQLETPPLVIDSYDGVIHTFISHTFVATGMSGGPALRDGKLVGVTQARDTDKNRTYIIPLSAFRRFVDSQVQHLNDNHKNDAAQIHNFQMASVMKKPIKIFVTYSHKDAEYLADDSLLGFLKGMEKDGVEFWDDRKIQPGEFWDEVIKSELADSRIALVLVSQAFLDSDYCQKIEIQKLLAHKSHLFPVILSACDWQRHEWLAKRQFIPTGGQSIEEHFTETGARKRLFLTIRNAILDRANKILNLNDELALSSDLKIVPAVDSMPEYSGKQKLLFCRQLGESWLDLADYLGILPHEKARFGKGDEARCIWEWLWFRRRLSVLPEAVETIGRKDLLALLTDSGVS